MSRSKVLRLFLVTVGACFLAAWFGASSSAEQEPASIRTAPSRDDNIHLIRSDTDSVVVEIHTPAYRLEVADVDGLGCQVLTVDGYGQTSDVGQPQLPVKGVLLGIPPTAELSLRVLELEGETIAGRYELCPSPELVVDQDLEGNIIHQALEFLRDEGVYSSDAFYPANVAEVGSIGFVRGQRIAELRFFPIRYNPVSGALRHCTRIRLELSFSYPEGRRLMTAGLEDDDSFNQVLQDSLLNYESAANWRVRPTPVSSGALTELQGEPAYKVLVDRDAIYQLTYAALKDAGVDVDNVAPGTFTLRNQGQEVAIYVAGEDDLHFDSDDYILFYGRQMTSTYTNVNVYWLTMGGPTGLRMPETDGTLGAGVILTSFLTTRTWEEDTYYQALIPQPASIPSDEELDHWFGGRILAPYGKPKSQTYPITLNGLATSSAPYTSTVRGYLHGRTDVPNIADHHTRVYLNGHLVDDAIWDGLVEYAFETDIPQSYLTEGSNAVSVQCPADLAGVANDFVYVERFEIDYHRTYTAENDALQFDADEAGTWQFELGGFLTDTIEVFDITDPVAVSRVMSATFVHSGGSYALQFENSVDREHRYLALTHHDSPLGIVRHTPSGLESEENGADYIIISHPDFLTDVLPLGDHRADEGLRTVVVDVRDIYDEFSYGIFDPHAIRDFLSYAYHNWMAPAPSYVLLVGDGNYDFKNNEGSGEPNYIPPYLVYADDWWGETAADNRYVCVSGDDILPDMYIGRLPAQTSFQASAMVEKIINYEKILPERGWTEQVLFVADDADVGGDFPVFSDDIADNHLPSPYLAQKVYYGTPPYTSTHDVHDAIVDAFDKGHLLIDYVGHGAIGLWGGDLDGAFLTGGDVGSLPAGQGMPVMLPMTCMEGYFIKAGAGFSCIAESLVRAQGKGAVASWSPTSIGYSSGHHYLHEGFYDAVFADGVRELGIAAELGKLALYQDAGGGHRELIDTYMLFGDPATKLAVRQHLFMPLALKR